ncbi:hypothetical protein ACFPFX_04005 [Streptomyces mauvecolor]|uniref:Uncharacterized protein n=1 Tax=Streptomyces mauvecolor TaxID=58345 RepID=A0ABV9UH82_9ACTN
MAIPQLPSVPPESCPLCDGKVESVTVYAGMSLPTVKFYRPDKMFARTSALDAVACVDCGHMLLFLENRGILAPGK